jgi:ABC-type transport system substrate-binding protein
VWSRRIDQSRAVRILAGLCVAGFLASACTFRGGAELSNSDASDLFGGTLRLALVISSHSLDDPAFLDPARPYDPFFRIDSELMRCCLVRTLLSYSGLPAEEGGTELRPDFASAMPTVSGDGLTWTFRLKHGIHYAPPLEEVEITAADVARAIRRTASAEASEGAYATYYSVIQGYDAFARGGTDTIPGLETVDDHTLRVHLTEVANDFGYRMALPGSAPIPPAPGDAASPLGVAEGHDDGYGRYLVGSGPYMVLGAPQLDPSEPPAEQPPVPGLTRDSLILVRNPSWDRSTDDLRAAYVDRIDLRVMEGDEAERGIDEGTVDGLFDDVNSAEQAARYLADPDLAGRVERRTNDFFVGYTAMNLAVPPFDDIHVRRAVSLAYDAQRWTRIANRHFGTYSFGIAGHLAPDGTLANLLQGYRPFPFDLGAAHEEMARSRYDDDGDGLCDDPACREIFALETDYGFERFADRVWIDGLREIGLTLDIRRIRNADRYAELSRDATRHVALNLGTYWNADYPNPSALFGSSFRAEGIGGGVGSSIGNVSLVGARPAQLDRWGYDVTDVPNVDAKIGTCRSLIGFAQTRCWAELDQQLMADVVPWVPQNVLQWWGIHSERVVRFPVDQAAGGWLALDHVALAPGSA